MAAPTDFCRLFRPATLQTGEDNNADGESSSPASSVNSLGWQLVGDGVLIKAMAATLPSDPDRAILLQLTSEPLDLPALYHAAVHPTCGAVSSFIGTTRNSFGGRGVSRLEYTGYREMVARSMLRIAAAEFASDSARHVNIHAPPPPPRAPARTSSGATTTETRQIEGIAEATPEAAPASASATTSRVPNNSSTPMATPGGTLMRVVIAHRLGSVPVGEPSVVIHVSSAHRRAAIEAASNLIETLKAQVPIWKKEFFTDVGTTRGAAADSGWCAPNDPPMAGSAAEDSRRRSRSDDVPQEKECSARSLGAAEDFAWKSNSEFPHGFH
jgi:molybdopterin synthase catalytic subunit